VRQARAKRPHCDPFFFGAFAATTLFFFLDVQLAAQRTNGRVFLFLLDVEA
jgi:hypothetical protein